MSKTSLQAAYNALLSGHRLEPNPSQAAPVTHLVNLQTDLTIPHKPPRGVCIYVFRWDRQIPPHRSLRLYPSSLNFLPQNPFSRIHVDIHTRPHRVGSQTSFSGDPLLQIGREVRGESRVLCFDEFPVTDIADALTLRLFESLWRRAGAWLLL
jgi:protein AFG1